MLKSMGLLLSVGLLTGCASIESSKDRFANVRNYDVGRSVNHSYSTPHRIIPHDESTDKYLYQDGKGCEWHYLVDKQTEMVKSWGYVSSPETCHLEIGWGSPW